jgi:hypothetical protein
MRKTIIVITVLMLALALTITGCANDAETAIPPTEVAETSSNTDSTSIEDVAENTIPDAEDADDVEEAMSDDTETAENPFVGTYRNGMGENVVITITDDGRLQFNENDLDLGNIQDDGSILAHEYVDEEYGEVWSRLFIYPVGVPLSVWSHETNINVETDGNRLRLFVTFTDVPDYRSNVYYKLETIGDISFLPTAGYTHEFALGGIVGGTGEEWDERHLVQFEDNGNGEVRRIVLATANSDEEFTRAENQPVHIYFEDSTGLYRREAGGDTGWTERLIGYPIMLGGTFEGILGTTTIVAVNETITTKAGTFENVVIVQDLDHNRHYYAPGVGNIRIEFARSIHELVNRSR